MVLHRLLTILLLIAVLAATACDPCDSFTQTCDAGPVELTSCLSGHVLVPSTPEVDRIALVQVGAYTLSEGGAYVVAADHKAEARISNNYYWEICGLPAGDYYVFGVGDDNHDGIFDHHSESYGSWPALDAPERIDLEPSTAADGFDFALAGGIFDGEG